MLSREEMIEICRSNTSSYDGIFFMAVRSTGIYCIASCPARFPKQENIEFYASRTKAESAGYRGCLRCHAAERQLQPPWVMQLVEFLHNHLNTKLTMTDLERHTGKHRSTITSYFLDTYGITPSQYNRQLKLEAAHRRILQGEDYRDVAYGLGYSSISGFRSAFKNHFNTTPGRITEVA